MRLNIKQIASYTGGTIVVSPIDAKGQAVCITWDSREVAEGCLFVALPGERVDGHDFVRSAIAQGATIALVERPLPEDVVLFAREMGAGIVEVPRTAAAITDLARAWRGFLKGKVISLTGSSGKTTTKNLVHAVLAARFSAVATQGNQNNELGVPRTLLAADAPTQMLVVEMGMRGRGQIESLCSFVKPDWALVTNVGESHIELLGSREGIACAKAEIYAALPAGTGVAFVNADGDFAAFMEHKARLAERGVRIVRYGRAAGAQDACDVWATDVQLDARGRPHFALNRREGFGSAGGPHKAFCRLNLMGLHSIDNALAAAAVGLQAGMALNDIAAALGAAEPAQGRGRVLQAGGITIIDDAYNANPESMRASLETFAALETAGRRIAVLGDMGELGSFGPECHRGIGRIAASLPLDEVICVGELSMAIANVLREGPAKCAKVRTASGAVEALRLARESARPGDAVLVKASHFMGLEQVVEGLAGSCSAE